MLLGRNDHPGHHGRLEWRLVLSILVDDIYEGAQRVSARHGLAGGLHHSDHRLQLCGGVLQGICSPPDPDQTLLSALLSWKPFCDGGCKTGVPLDRMQEHWSLTLGHDPFTMFP